MTVRASAKRPAQATAPENLPIVEEAVVVLTPLSAQTTPQYLGWMRRIVPVANKIILVSGVTVYVLAFVLAGFATFATPAETPDPLIQFPKPTGVLGVELKEAGTASSYADSTGRTVNLGIILGKFIANFFFGAAGTAFTIFIFHAGFTWLIAAGDEEKIKKARAIIFHSIIGLGVSLAALSLSAGWLQILTKAVTPYYYDPSYSIFCSIVSLAFFCREYRRYCPCCCGWGRSGDHIYKD